MGQGQGQFENVEILTIVIIIRVCKEFLDCDIMATYSICISLLCLFCVVLSFLTSTSAFSLKPRLSTSVNNAVRYPMRNNDIVMKVNNDAFTRANRAQRQVQGKNVDILVSLSISSICGKNHFSPLIFLTNESIHALTIPMCSSLCNL